jgi:hypothetical protein
VTEPSAAPAKDNGGLRRIGLWGATQSGKSTFLAALYIAVNRSSQDLRIYGRDDRSTDFLIRNTSLLNASHIFPSATIDSQELSWIMSMRVPDRQRRWFKKHANGTVPFNFNIDLQDVRGGLYAAVPPEDGPSDAAGRLTFESGRQPNTSNSDSSAVASYLAGCHGVLLLVDPIRERTLGDAHEYFHGTLLKMAQRAMPDIPAGERLPHYVAVCVTKYDDPLVFGFARDNSYPFLSDGDPRMFPRVHDSDAERFLRELCRGYRRSDIELVTSSLNHYFHPERIRYFATSAVGFYTDESGLFREEDFQNVVPEQDNSDVGKVSYRIRGQIHPINVVEPLLWLGESVAASL